MSKRSSMNQAAKASATVASATDDEAGVAHGTVAIRPGFVVLDCSTATGGVTHQRTPTVSHKQGDGRVEDWSTTRHVDHAQIVKESDALVKQVDYLLRVHASRTGFGWFADGAAVAKIRNGLVDVHAKADALNKAARKLGSARRTHIGVIFAKLDVAHEDVAQEIYRVARANLQAIYDALRAGTVGQELDTALVRAKNTGNVASGLLRTALDAAMGQVSAWRADVRAGLKQGVAPEAAGAALDLGALEAAMQLLEPWNPGY
jgi:hypothetical protein